MDMERTRMRGGLEAAMAKRTLRKRTKKMETAGRVPGKAAPTAKPELQHTRWSSVELEDLNPLLQRQLVVGHQIMLARVLLKTGCVVPRHSHHNEQVSYVLNGALRFSVDGREIVVNAGDVLTIPPHMPHKVVALVDSVSLDIFHPPRQDWIDKTDRYLRAGK
jgi:quercetin dioxygenase-like cupin family protein